MGDKDKILGKIKKLLSLAGNNSSSAEAESAFLKAQELMLQHKIEEAELHKDKKSDIKITKAVTTEPSNTPWAKQLARIFAKNFGCMHYLQRSGKSSMNIVFFGDEEDAETCKGLYDYAVVWLNKSACSYATMRRNKFGEVKGVKQDYILGFLKGLEDKFKEQYESNNQYALMIVVPLEVKKEYANLGLSNHKSSQRMNTHGSEEARAAGYSAGKSFGTDRITGG